MSPGKKNEDEAVGQNDEEGDPMVSGKISDLNGQRDVELGISQILPWQSGEKEPPDIIKSHPDKRSGPDGVDVLCPADQAAENCGIEGHVGREKQKSRVGEPPW